MGVHWDTTTTSSPLREATKYTARVAVGVRAGAPIGVLGGTLVTPGACKGGTFMDATFPPQCGVASVRFTLTALAPHSHIAAPAWLSERYPELLHTPWWSSASSTLHASAPGGGWGRHRGYTRNPLTSSRNTKWGFNAVASAHGMVPTAAPAPVLFTPLYNTLPHEVLHFQHAHQYPRHRRRGGARRRGHLLSEVKHGWKESLGRRPHSRGRRSSCPSGSRSRSRSRSRGK